MGKAKNVGSTADCDGVVCKVDKNSQIIEYDAEFASRQLLGKNPYTSDGKFITPHAAERMVNPPPGRSKMSIEEIEEVLKNPTSIKKISAHPEGYTITIQNKNMPGKPQVIISDDGLRIVTVIKNKVK